ncbi:MAG: alpha/beta hydrolase [Rhodospirillaceae bacterium]
MPELMIDGPVGRLEARFSPAEQTGAPVALLLHPHPLYGGAMNDRVLFTVHRALSRAGFATLRFNFRGVGRSAGGWSNGAGELEDAGAALDWLKRAVPDASAVRVVGYSFGAWIALQLAVGQRDITDFIALAPPVSLLDFSFLTEWPASGLILQGDRDEIAPEAETAALIRSRPGKFVDYCVIAGADHFFSDRLDEVALSVDRYRAGHAD